VFWILVLILEIFFHIESNFTFINYNSVGSYSLTSPLLLSVFTYITFVIVITSPTRTCGMPVTGILSRHNCGEPPALPDPYIPI